MSAVINNEDVQTQSQGVITLWTLLNSTFNPQLLVLVLYQHLGIGNN